MYPESLVKQLILDSRFGTDTARLDKQSNIIYVQIYNTIIFIYKYLTPIACGSNAMSKRRGDCFGHIGH